MRSLRSEKNIRHYKNAPYLGIWDFYVLLLIIFLSTIALKYYLAPEEGKFCTVYVEGEEVLELPLSVDTETEIPGTHALLTISRGGASITENDCPNKICIKTGFVSDAGGVIVCAPNKIVVRISGEKSYVTGVHG